MSTSEHLEGYAAYLTEKVRQLEKVYAQFADIEKVVRCKVCTKSHEKNMFGVVTILVCRRTDLAVEPDGFCAWGERRSET